VLGLDVECVELGEHRPVVLHPIVVEQTRLDGGVHSAAGLDVVAAVGEPAALRKCINVREGARDAVVGLPHTDGAQTRRVDQDAATRKQEQLSMCRGMPAATVRFADRVGLLHIVVEQSVDEGRLSDTRGADERDRTTRPRVLGQLLDTAAVEGARDDNIDTQGARPGELGDCFGMIARVGLREHDDWGRAALPAEGELAFEASEIQRERSGVEHEHDVDVCRDDLGLKSLRVAAAERGPAGDDLDDDVVIEQDPIADRRSILGLEGALQLAREPGAAQPVGTDDRVHPAVDARDPAEHPDGIGREGAEAVVEPVRFARVARVARVCHMPTLPSRSTNSSAITDCTPSIGPHGKPSNHCGRGAGKGDLRMRGWRAVGELETRHIDRSELRDVVAAAARAFFDDPLMNFFQRDPLRQQRMLPGIFAAAIHDCFLHGEVWGAFADGRPRGVAAWLPPGVPIPTKGTRALGQARRSMPAMLATRGRVRAAVRLLGQVAAAHPRYPHWYLGVLAVDPSYQGRGLGGALLDPVHERADSDAVPSYLETQKPENLAYYRRFGYEVVDELQVDRCPPIWTMERAPRS